MEWGTVSGLMPQCILKWKNQRSDHVHASVNKGEAAQREKATEDGETEGQGQENEDWVWNDRAKNSKKEHCFISLLNHSTQTKQW